MIEIIEDKKPAYIVSLKSGNDLIPNHSFSMSFDSIDKAVAQVRLWATSDKADDEKRYITIEEVGV